MLRAFGVAASPLRHFGRVDRVRSRAAEQDDKMPRQVLHSICRGGFMGL